MKDLAGKVAVVTGAASGIGRGLAEAFVATGMKVVLADVEVPALEATARALADAGGEVLAVRTDVSKQEEVNSLAQRTLAKYGAVHVLCNNAGIGALAGDTPGGGASWDSPLQDWQWVMGVNLWGVIHGVRAFLPMMIAQDTEAHIVNTASLAGLVASATLYGTTKFAVVGLSENLYLELLRSGKKPRVSVLCPGMVATNIGQPERNRPADLATPTPVAATLAAAREWFKEHAMKGALDPRAVAEQVLAAIREERFWILTHPEFNPAIEARVKTLLRGQNPVPGPPPPGIESLLAKLRDAS